MRRCWHTALSRLSFKNTATSNDDAVNTRVQATLGIVFQEETP